MSKIYFEDEVGGFEKIKKSNKKNKFKGHQSRHNKNDKYFDADETFEEYNVITENAVQKPVIKNTFKVEEPKPITLKGSVTLDLNKIQKAEEIQNLEERINRMTYGILITFKGKNAYTRIIWYNIRKKERDQDLQTITEQLKSL